MYTTGILYETRKSGRVPVGVEIPIRFIGAATSVTIMGSEQPPAALANMANIDTISSPYAEGYQRFNSLPRFISFVGTGVTDIEVSNVALDPKGAIV